MTGGKNQPEPDPTGASQGAQEGHEILFLRG
jgi:hypothetical protein